MASLKTAPVIEALHGARKSSNVAYIIRMIRKPMFSYRCRFALCVRAVKVVLMVLHDNQTIT